MEHDKTIDSSRKCPRKLRLYRKDVDFSKCRNNRVDGDQQPCATDNCPVEVAVVCSQEKSREHWRQEKHEQGTFVSAGLAGQLLNHLSKRQQEEAIPQQYCRCSKPPATPLDGDSCWFRRHIGHGSAGGGERRIANLAPPPVYPQRTTKLHENPVPSIVSGNVSENDNCGCDDGP